jgi:hypothetical protein
LELGKFQRCVTYLVAGHGPISSAVQHRLRCRIPHQRLGEVRAERGFGKGMCGEKRGTTPPPLPSTVRSAPRPLQPGVREKMREIRYERTPRTAAASYSPPPSSTVRCCRHSPFCSSSQIRQRESPREPRPGEGEIKSQERDGGGRNRTRFGSVRWEQVGFHPAFQISQPSEVNPMVKNET